MIIVSVDSTALPLRKLQSTNLGRDRFSRTDLTAGAGGRNSPWQRVCQQLGTFDLL
jgi:hypothetical protein